MQFSSHLLLDNTRPPVLPSGRSHIVLALVSIFAEMPPPDDDMIVDSSPTATIPPTCDNILRNQNLPSTPASGQPSIKELIERITILEKTVKEQSKKIAELEATKGFPLITNDASKSKSKLYSAVVQNDPQSVKIIEKAHFAADLRKLGENSIYAIIENVPDCKKEEQTTIDASLMENLANLDTLPKPEKFFRIKCKKPDVPSRPLKVKFATEYQRDTFIRQFSKALHNLPERPVSSRTIWCRRDMSPEELILLKQRRATAYEENRKAGVIKYYVRDLDICELSTPRPLTAQITPTSAPGLSSST